MILCRRSAVRANSYEALLTYCAPAILWCYETLSCTSCSEYLDVCNLGPQSGSKFQPHLHTTVPWNKNTASVFSYIKSKRKVRFVISNIKLMWLITRQCGSRRKYCYTLPWLTSMICFPLPLQIGCTFNTLFITCKI